jgi:hypothetical protein
VSSYPLVKYVDSPAATAVVRYDFNDQKPFPETNPIKKVTAFDPGVPTLEGDPDAVGQQWGLRSPSITHTIKGTKAQAMAALTLLSREQLRRTNWLLFQPSAGTQPVWFKTYRTSYQPVILEQVWVRPDGGGQVPLADTWKITVPLVTDAFAYGARQNINTAQVVQGPTDLTGPPRTAMRIVLPSIKGDAPAPLRIVVTPTASTGGPNNQTWLLGVVQGSASMTDPIKEIGTGDGLTAGTGTAAGSADATFFNGSLRVVTIGAATPNLLSRLSGNLVGVPPGRYKVLLRCEADGSSGVARTYVFQLGMGAVYKYGTSVTVTANARLTTGSPVDAFKGWVDLGDFQFPADVAVPSDLAITAASPVTAVDLKIGTADGSAGTVRLDALKLIPIQGTTVERATMLYTKFQGGNASIGATLPGTWDGDLETVWGIATSGGFDWQPIKPSLRGQFPVVDPAQPQNLLIVMCTYAGDTLASTTTAASVNAQAGIDISYYPRFLHVGDGT